MMTIVTAMVLVMVIVIDEVVLENRSRHQRHCPARLLLLIT